MAERTNLPLRTGINCLGVFRAPVLFAGFHLAVSCLNADNIAWLAGPLVLAYLVFSWTRLPGTAF